MEIQIRGIKNQKQADKIVNILFCVLWGQNNPNAYKNEFNEQVNEFTFYGFNKENMNRLKKEFKEEFDFF